MKRIKAIETKYKGYRFRSRLEARWAIFFDVMGFEWEYEPEGYDLDGIYYLPDFKVRYPSGYYHWFEVKPTGKISEGELEKIVKFSEIVSSITILDGTPQLGSYITLPFDYNYYSDETEGLSLKEYIETTTPTTRFGDVLYVRKDGGRMWAAEWGGSLDDFFSDDMMDALIAARSARFEHGEKV